MQKNKFKKQDTTGVGEPIILQKMVTGNPTLNLESFKGITTRGEEGEKRASDGLINLSSIFGVLITTPSAEV